MKKTIIALAVATIAFGGIYLFNDTQFQKTELKSNKTKETKKNIDNRISKLKNKEMGLDKKTSEPIFEVQDEFVFDIELVEKKEFFDYKDNSFFVIDDFKQYTDDPEINKIIDTPLKNYETDEVIKIKNYFIFDYLTPKDLALAVKGVNYKGFESFELYMIDYNEKSKYKKVKFSNCNSEAGCRSYSEMADMSYSVSDGVGKGVIYNKDSKITYIYVTKKGEVLIYDKNDENGNFIPEIQFYKKEG